MRKNSKPLISVVIATRNEQHNIARCIKSIRGQTYKNFEIIVVDNSDNQLTLDAIKKLKIKKFSKLKKNKKIINYRGAQVNQGASMAKGKILFFPDADMSYGRNLLSDVVNLMNDYDALYVKEKIVGKGFFSRIRDFERSFYNQTLVDAVRVIKKQLYLDVGGYDEKTIEFGPDDWDFTKKVRKTTNKIGITNEFSYHHESNLNWLDFIIKKKNYVSSFRSYRAKWGEDDEDIKKQLGVYYRAIGIFLEDDKWKRLIKNPHLALGMFLLRFITYLLYVLYK